MVERRYDLSARLPRILAVVGAAVVPFHSRVQYLDFPAELTYLRHRPREVPWELVAVCNFLLQDRGQVLRIKAMALLNVRGRVDARANDVRFAELFTCHLQEQQLMAFRGRCGRYF